MLAQEVEDNEDDLEDLFAKFDEEVQGDTEDLVEGAEVEEGEAEDMPPLKAGSQSDRDEEKESEDEG